mmetsp:Transcript_55821/g.167299  ORF Transcript_55821/g.167299 Transcript_55821/m.167299 type:complete len:442 (-) Transcript_55821:80-1405(-)
MHPFLTKHRQPILRYAPTLLVEIGWWTWALLDAPTNIGRFAQPSPYGGYNYYLTLTMALGSLVAGATSEGGGAVAFPVMTLALGVPPPVARDFSFAIQSFGMTCAGITILGLAVPVDVEAIIWGTAGGAVGLAGGLVGVAPFLPAAYAKLLFVSVWVAFAVALYRLNRADKERRVYTSAGESDEALHRIHRGEAKDEANVIDESDKEDPVQEEESGGTAVQEERSRSETAIKSKSKYRRAAVIVVTSLFGGLCTSIAGSGLDMATFSILTLYYRVDEKVATPTSVILMAGNAILGVIFRLIGLGGRYAGGEETYIWVFVSVCIPVVVIGAPLGATISSRLSRGTIAGLLYLLDGIQFIAALAIVRPWSASPPNNIWLCVSSGLTLIVGSIFFYKIANWGEKRDKDMETSHSASSMLLSSSVTEPASSAEEEAQPDVWDDSQ